MRHIDDPDILLYSATKVATDLGLSHKELVERAGTLGIDFWIEPPQGLTIFSIITNNLNGHPFDSPPIKSNVFLTPSFPSLKKLLCVTATEAKTIVQLQSIEKNEFERAAIFSSLQETFFALAPKDFYRCISQAAQLSAMHLPEFDFCNYDTAETRFGMRTDTEMESTHFRVRDNSIIVRFDDLRLGREALALLSAENTPEAIDYGQFEPGRWTSSKLKHLNEASTRFFSSLEAQSSAPSDKKKEHIRNWFKGKWTRNTSPLLFEEALLAILPDQFNQAPPLLDDRVETLREGNNRYASRTLMLINAAAKDLYQRDQEGTERWSHKAASVELEKTYGLNARMAAQAAIIICPDHRSRSLSRKP